MNPDTSDDDLPEFNVSTVPWWRIINSQGRISLVEEAKQRQIDRLREENVVVSDDGAVNLQQFGWYEEPDFN